MRTSMEIMVREDPEPSCFVNVTRVCVNLGEIIDKAMMLQDCLDEEKICITHNPQITPAKLKFIISLH